MRILYANAYYHPHQPGGAEVMMQAMAEGMLARGHQVSVMTTAEHDSLDEVNGIPVYRMGLRNVFWKLPKDAKPAWQKLLWHGMDRDNPLMRAPIRHVLRKVGPDILVSNNLPGMSIALWREAKALNIPIVHVLHDYYLMCPSVTMHKDGHNCTAICGSCRAFRGPHAAMSNQVDAVVGVSQAILNTHLKHGVFAQTPIKRVIYNARDLPNPVPRDSKAPGQEAHVVFGFIGAVSEVKGVEPLIHAFMEARRSCPHITLRIAGAGEESFVNRLKAIAPSDIVRFDGRVDAMSFFREIDVCIAPSQWHDPLPGVVFEALSQGVPVIGSSTGGIPEMVQDRVNGLIFDPQRPQTLTDAIRLLASDEPQRRQFAGHAASSAAKFTAFERMIGEHAALFDEVLHA